MVKKVERNHTADMKRLRMLCFVFAGTKNVSVYDFSHIHRYKFYFDFFNYHI